MKPHPSFSVRLVAALACSIGITSPAKSLTPEECYTIAGTEWFAGSGAALVTPAPLDFAFGVSAFAANLLLKECPAKLDAPPAVGVFPNTANACAHNFAQPTTQGDYVNNVDLPSILFSVGNLGDGLQLGDFGRETLQAEPDLAIPFTVPVLLKPLLTLNGEDFYPYVRAGDPLIADSSPGGFPSWGDIGTPQVTHFRTEVQIELVPPPGSSGPNNFIQLPLGQNRVRWEADTLISPLDYLLFPIPKLEARKGDKKATKVLIAALNTLSSVKPIVIRGVRYSRRQGFEPITEIFAAQPHGVKTSTFQTVTVWDNVDPTISAPAGTAVFDAVDIGGVRLSRLLDDLQDSLAVSDDCRTRAELEISLDTSEFIDIGGDFLIPLGSHTLSWQVADPGPNSSTPEGGPVVRNSAFDTQAIVVEDRFAPSLLPPPDLMFIGNAAVAAANIELGSVQIFDLADPFFSVVRPDLPVSMQFEANERTQLRWTAMDSSGNESEAFQWVTVKSSNTAPFADSGAAIAETFTPVDIQIFGHDDDAPLNVRDADGVLQPAIADPLSLRIENPPANGFLEAPLLPYFVDDYRILTSDICFEAGVRKTDSACVQDLETEFCGLGEIPQLERIPRDFVWDPEYVVVTDDGTTYILDNAIVCRGGQPGFSIDHRISKWDAQGQYQANFLLQDATARVSSFSIDAMGSLHYFRRQSGVSDNNASLITLSADLDLLQNVLLTMDQPSAPRLLGAVPGKDGLIYGAAVDRLLVLQMTTPQDLVADEIGVVFTYPQQPTSDDLLADIAVDSDGDLYLSLPQENRIYKIDQSRLDESNALVPGGLQGWIGRCDSRLDPTTPASMGCDIVTGRSLGFTCTDAICGVNGSTAGSEAGQFSSPRGIAFDPNDNLYVTDHNNARVQRFSSTGLFAGEADSNSNAPDDQIGFVLSEFFAPVDVSVNSTHFYTVNQAEDLLFSFEAMPFKEVTADSATVTYVSNPGYRGPDSFSFRSSDGFRDGQDALVESALAGVMSIDVQRGHNAPIPAVGVSATVTEDIPLGIQLQAFDPDGVLDTLTYSLTVEPTYGSVLINGDIATYTPNLNFEGLDEFGNPVTDEFRFNVTDGEFDVEGTVEVVVVGAFDAATIEIDAFPDPSPVGYTVTVQASFFDVDFGQTHPAMRINWGDGTFRYHAEVDDFLDTELIEFDPGSGIARAHYTYSTSTATSVEICISDDPLIAFFDSDWTPSDRVTCESVPISLQPNFVDLRVIATSPDAGDVGVVAGSTVTATVQIMNRQSTAGLPTVATDVVLTTMLPSGVGFVSAGAPSGTCEFALGEVTCNFAEILPTATLVISMELEILDGQLPGESADIVFVADSAEPDAFEDNGEMLSFSVLCDPTFCPSEGIAHRGANDPETEGWQHFELTGSASVIEGPVLDALSLDAWSIDDRSTGSGTTAFFTLNPVPADWNTAGQASGWLFRTRMRVVPPGPGIPDGADLSVVLEYSDGNNLWMMGFGTQADGDPIVSPAGLSPIPLDTLGDGFHLYDLTFDPETSKVSLYVDGALVLDDFPGLPVGAGRNRIVFGANQTTSTGHAEYNLVSWNVLGQQSISQIDTDGDTLTDFEELALAADPSVPFDFEWELADDADIDLDGDGFGSADELEAGSDQLDANDTPFDRSLLRVGDLLVTAPAGGLVDVIPTTGEQFEVSGSTNFEQPTGVAIDSFGHIYVVDNSLESVLRINPATGVSTTLSSGGELVAPGQIALDTNEDLVVTIDGGVVWIDAASGDQQLLASGDLLLRPWGIAIAESGDIYVTDSDSAAVVRVNEADGSQDLISQDGFLAEPRGLSFEPLTGMLLVADATTDAVVRVNPENGGQAIVSIDGELLGPQGIAVSLNDEIVTAVDADAVIGVDPVDGFQRLIADSGLLLSPTDVTLIPEPSRTWMLAAVLAMTVWSRRSARLHRREGGPKT